MSKISDKIKTELDGEATVVVDTREVEERLRVDMGKLDRSSDSDMLIYPDGLDLSEFVCDEDVTVAETVHRDNTHAGETPRRANPFAADPAQRVYQPVDEQPAAELRPEKSESAKRIIAEKSAERERRAQKKRKLIIICSVAAVIIALVIASLALRGAAQHREYEENYNAAQNYYYDGDYDKALDSLRKAMSVDKTDECLLLMSACYEAKGDYVNAIAILESSNSGSGTVEKRIKALKKAKEEFEEGKTVLVCGEPYDIETTTLDLSGKRIRSDRLAELSQLTKLENLKLSDNLITSLDFLKPLSCLVTLDLSTNNITDISALSGLQTLKTLHLDENKIEDFTPLYALRNLSSLTISGMEISESQLKALKEALPDCIIFSEEASEDVVELKLGGRTFKSDVTELDLSNCGISSIYELSVCTKLTKLDLSGNSIQDLSPLMDMPELKNLDLSDNKISNIGPLMGLTKLERLNLEGNSVNSLAALSDLTKLTELYLKGNPLKNISAIAKLTELKYLGLQNTGIDDNALQKLYGLKNLKTAALEENSALTKNGVDELKKKLPNCKITHSEFAVQLEIGGTKVNVDAETVNLSGLGITDISALSELSAVKYLDLSNNAISDFTALYGLQTLKELDVSGTNITPDQIAALEQALPNCVVNAM